VIDIEPQTAAGKVLLHFLISLDGFVAGMSRAQALRTSLDQRVAYVEQDAVVRLSETQTPATWASTGSTSARCPSTARTRTRRRAAA